MPVMRVHMPLADVDMRIVIAKEVARWLA